MNGYIKNVSPIWKHAFKRAVGPGKKINLDELYEQYGVKHGIAEGEDFVNWLKSVKLKDISGWKIYFEDSEVKKEDIKVESIQEPLPETKVKNSSFDKSTPPFNKKIMSAEDLVNLTDANTKEVLKRVTDAKMLKQAIDYVKSLPDKDNLCRALRKRFREVELSKR